MKLFVNPFAPPCILVKFFSFFFSIFCKSGIKIERVFTDKLLVTQGHGTFQAYVCEVYQPIFKLFVRNVVISALQGAQSQQILLVLTCFPLLYRSLSNGIWPLYTAIFECNFTLHPFTRYIVCPGCIVKHIAKQHFNSNL